MLSTVFLSAHTVLAALIVAPVLDETDRRLNFLLPLGKNAESLSYLQLKTLMAICSDFSTAMERQLRKFQEQDGRVIHRKSIYRQYPSGVTWIIWNDCWPGSINIVHITL